MVSTRNRRNWFISTVFCARRNSAREFQGHGCPRPTPRSNVGNFAPRFDTKLTSFGKLSSNGPRRPFGYQMKWPMPSDAKSSPAFHEGSPAFFPLHSFFHIFFPILRTSACEREVAWGGLGRRTMSPAKTNAADEEQC